MHLCGGMDAWMCGCMDIWVNGGMIVCMRSHFPFPLQKRWTRAGYQTWFGGEFTFQRWNSATDHLVRGHALHLVAVWSRATDPVVRGSAPHIVAIFHCLNTFELSCRTSERHFAMIYVGMHSVTPHKKYSVLLRVILGFSATCCMVALDVRVFLDTHWWMTLVLRTAFCSITRVHAHFVDLTASPFRWALEQSKNMLSM